MRTLQKAYRHIREHLQQAGTDNPDRESRIFLKYVAGVQDVLLIAGEDRGLTAEEQETLEEYVRRRLAGEPVTRILGETEFYGLPFMVTPDVLDPRPETEIIIDLVLKRFEGRPGPKRILDLGTGSGCLIVTLLHYYKHSSGVAVDLSSEALKVAEENAEKNNVADRIKCFRSNWGEEVTGPFDLIVSNPPYIEDGAVDTLDIAVKAYDPHMALKGGIDGLDPYRTILADMNRLLVHGGCGFLETGKGQTESVAAIARKNKLSVRGIYPDLSGISRVVEISSGDK